VRIGFICYRYPPNDSPGGIRTFVKTLTERLRHLGHELTVVSQESILDRPARNERVDGVDVFRFRRTAMLPRMLTQRVQLTDAVKRVVRRQNLDVVECYEEAGMVLSSRLGCPLVVRMHTAQMVRRMVNGEPSSSVADFFERRLLRIADALVGVSEWLARTTMALARLPDLPYRVIYNGVDTERFSPAPVGASDQNLILFAGALIARKGLPVLFEAIPEVMRRFPGVRLRCVGADPHQSGYPARTAERYLSSLPPELRSRVEFAGPIAHERMPAEYQRAGLCVFPSLLEGHPLTVLEAMACGTPTVFTRCGVGPEIMSHGDDGFLSGPGDPRDLAGVICLALERIRTDDSIRVRARRKVESQFSLELAVAANVAMYEEVIRGAHRD
jgi:glycosyltransferase involved in cell wall biosynthesis